MRTDQYFCRYDSVHDYCKCNQPIALKLGVMIGPSNRKNLLTFGGDPVPDTDYGSLPLNDGHGSDRLQTNGRVVFGLVHCDP